jgi:hypothetical protein
MLALVFVTGCGSRDINGQKKMEDLYVENGGKFRLNPVYVPIIFGVIITLVVGGIITVIVVGRKRDKNRKELIVSDIDKAHKSGDILDADYEEIKKGLDPINYTWLARTFDFALANKRRSDYLLSKYPKEIAKDLFEQKLWIGMTIEQLVDSRGHPTKKEDEILKTKTTRKYIYTSAKGTETLCFVDGILDRIDPK